MQSTHLPTELWDAVFDNLSDLHDRTTLSTCSLTCKAFLRASHRRLYTAVVLQSRPSPAITANHFLRIIRSPSLLVNPSSFVRRLCIRYRHHPSHAWVNEALPILATCLLEVTALKLECLNWRFLGDGAKSAIMSGFKKVKYLDLEESEFWTPDEMCATITAFPSLTHLLCPHIRLETDVPCPANHFDRSLNTEQFSNLRKIECLYISQPVIVAIGNLLRTIGSNLEHLDLGGSYVERDDSSVYDLGEGYLIFPSLYR
jgi:hypothetical protein